MAQRHRHNWVLKVEHNGKPIIARRCKLVCTECGKLKARPIR